MARASLTTGYARLTPRQARVALGAVVATFMAGVAVTLLPLASTNIKPHPKRDSDVALYRAEVGRIRNGEGYYQAAAAELTARGYPTRSVFNWRTPLPMWLLGKMPTMALGKMLLGGLAVALMLMAFEALARDEIAERNRQPMVAIRSATAGRRNVPVRAVACLMLLTGPLLPTILGDLCVVPVLWAGVFIGLSACAYGIGRPRLGIACGLAAAFFRELALLYCLICVAMAWWRGRRGERALWAVGLTAWGVFFALHWWEVSGLIAAEGRAHRQSWIQFGGAGFVISTAQMNAYLLLLPQWVTAIYLVAAMVGMAGWNTPLGARIGLSTCAFLTMFAVVGHSFNQYWGSLIGPLLCFGVVRFPASMRDLWRAGHAPRPASDVRPLQGAD